MSAISTSRLFQVMLILLVWGFSISSVLAFGSGDKSPEEEALENVKKAIKKHNNGNKHMNKAQSHAEKGDSLFAYNYRATSDAKARKEYEKAVKDYKEALKLNPEIVESHSNLGYCLRKLGLLDESLAAYNAALELDTAYAQAREYRGELMLARGELAEAEKELAYLNELKSEHAATLQKAIDIYKLQEINLKLQQDNGRQPGDRSGFK